MATFFYNAIDVTGKSVQGKLTADTRAAALDELVGKGLVPVTVTGAESGNDAGVGGFGGRLFKPRVSAAHVESFTRELANLLSAGVPLARALAILHREASNPAAKAQWQQVHEDVTSGKPLADALAKSPESFPQVYVAMVRAGETGGFLELVLNQIADFRAREAELTGRVKSAMVYPCVLALLAVCVLIFLLTFFIPRFAPIFEGFGAALPLLTQVIIKASNIIIHYGLFALLGVVVGVVLLLRYMKTDAGRRMSENVMLRLPGIGIVTARFALVRFARMLGTLLGAGVPLVMALRVAQEAIGNQTLSDAVGGAIEQVREGGSLSKSLSACKELFPASVVEMIAVAEESGRLDKELLRLATTYEAELDRRLRMLVALAEPMLLIVMAGLIGTIVVGMLLPIFNLQELIK
jgi:type II secretory pathway component PulF